MNLPNKALDQRKKIKLRQDRFRKFESEKARGIRLEKLRTAARERLANETSAERSERLSKVRRSQKRKRDTSSENQSCSKPLSNLRREQLWRMVNQNIEPNNNETLRDLNNLATCYERDLKRFKQSMNNFLYNIQCSVCGLTMEGDKNIYEIGDKIFDPLKKVSLPDSPKEWEVYKNEGSPVDKVCTECVKTLKRKTNNIPRFSRANIPIPDPIDDLRDLTFIEQMLISPVLPMVFVWRYKTFGQYQSKGQCVAFRNRVQKVAETLPRTLAEIFVNVKDLYGHSDITIRVKSLRKALIFLKLNHPAYESIEIKEESFEKINEEIISSSVVLPVKNGSSDNIETLSACQMVQDSGQRQVVEEHVAQVALTTPLTVEASDTKQEISEAIKHLFKSISQKQSPKYSPQSTLQGWALMFPCLLWNGRGGPDSCIDSKVSLREWINYVIQIPSLDFRNNVIFISFANIVLRRQRITGLTSHKPISSSVEQAVKELIRISQSPHPAHVPEATLNTLSRKVGAYVDHLPGSLSDMRKFRNDILSMKKKHGPPTFFLTLSSADSMWPEGFVAATRGMITLRQARELSAIERANLMAQNPVAFTQIWKKRVQGFLDFVIHGESKPLGNITHYVQKSEWQGRLSEHVHFLFWTKDGIPPLHLYDNGDLNGSQDHICLKAEALGSTMIHLYHKSCPTEDEYAKVEKDINSSKDGTQKKEFKALSKEDVFKTVTGSPISFHDYFQNGNVRNSVNDLVRSVNLHACSAYCTSHGKTTCKSRFPFQINNKSTIKTIIDKNRNRSYRVHLRRNHSRVNPYSVPVLNFWRANMDLTVLCGSPFASIIYVTYYTSKLDRSSNIRDVLQKIKKLDENSETRQVLRKLLINMDTCRSTGLPEASSNLLLFPHRYTSSKVLRLDTRPYLSMSNELNEEDSLSTSHTLNSILHEATKADETFALPDPTVLHTNYSRTPAMDKITENYLNRPLMVFEKEQNAMIESRHMSMIEYTENYKVTKKRKLTNETQSKDERNKIVEPREPKEQDITLDLKYRISPPNPQDPKWCAGALALHVQHNSIQELLSINGNQKTFVEAYEFYHSRITTNENGESISLYPLLHKFAQNETDLYVATNATKFLPLHPVNKKRQNAPDDLEDLYNKSEEVSNFSEEQDLDPDEYSSAIINATTCLKEEKCKPWNGNLNDEVLSAQNPWSINYTNSLPATEPTEVMEEHKSFMSLLLAGKNPNTSNENAEVEQALSYANGNRKKAASQFLNRTMNECKNDEQRKAIKTVINVLEAYYYGKFDSCPKVTRQSVKNTPVMTMIGVPGAGKSWVIGKVRNWVDIRFKTTDLPYKSPEFKTLNQKIFSDPVTGNIQESITRLPEGKYGKSVAFAFSGAAAGIIKGFTVHHGFSFPVNMNKQVKTGELPLPDLKETTRTKLLECWCSVKLIIIDEVYMLKVEWLSLIDERLRQIFNSNLPFAGIPVLLAGDPRQIVPVNGKALFTISKYFNLENVDPELTTCGISSLSEREEKGFLLYASSQFAIPLTKSVRLSNKEFADLNMNIAQYKLTPKHIEEVNSFCRPMKLLQTSPWIDSPWLFPTWEEVNGHLQFVTERAKKIKGIFRAWCPITVESSQPLENAKKALKIFYQSSTYVSAKFTCPLPYIDYFMGQIVCLKKNWNPTWKLFNNAKAFVVGIKCTDPERQKNPLMTIDEAINMTLKCPESLRFELLVKPLIPFTGPSALANVQGVIAVPWTKVNRKILGCKMVVEGPVLFPANAFSHHQSQGSTFDRCVSSINENCKAYGMANVVTSRTPQPQRFALSTPITLKTLQPCPHVSSLVEKEYVRLTEKAN